CVHTSSFFRIHGSRSAGVCTSTGHCLPGPNAGLVPRATRNQGADLLRASRNRALLVSARAETDQLPAVVRERLRVLCHHRAPPPRVTACQVMGARPTSTAPRRRPHSL